MVSKGILRTKTYPWFNKKRTKTIYKYIHIIGFILKLKGTGIRTSLRNTNLKYFLV